MIGRAYRYFTSNEEANLERITNSTRLQLAVHRLLLRRVSRRTLYRHVYGIHGQRVSPQFIPSRARLSGD